MGGGAWVCSSCRQGLEIKKDAWENLMCLENGEKVFVAKTFVSEGAEKGVGDEAGEVG